MNSPRAISAALSLAALVAASSAQAAGPNKASAEITNLKIELIDLRPDDGIAPSVGFRTSFQSASSYDTMDNSDDEQKLIYSPGSTAISRSFGGTAGWSTDTTLGANAQVWTIKDLTDSSFASSGSKDIYYHSLSAHTLLRVSGTVVLNVDKTGGEQSFAHARWSGSTDIGYPATADNQFSGSLRLDSDGSLTQDFTADLYGDYRNYGDLSFVAGAYTYTSAVPEPATYGMLVAGLAMIGLRRRTKRSETTTHAQKA